MFAKAVFAFLALPGVVAFAVPIVWLFAGSGAQLTHPWGLVPLLVGIVGLLWCVRDFYVAGKGTLAPWAPPEHLVVVGLYQYTRNPMYVCVTLILLGWAVSFNSPDLYIYTVIVVVAVHLRVVFGEEPWLARKHGKQWHDYVRRVPRWLV